MAKNVLTIFTKLDTKSFDAQIEELERKLEDLEATANDTDIAPKEGTQEYLELQTAIEKTKNKLGDLRKKQEEVNKSKFDGVKESMTGIGESTEKLIKKITKWGLAVFGIKSMYMLVRRSMSVLSEYNQQLADDVEYIRYTLATTLQKPIEWIIKAVYTLLSYVNYLSQTWFGINLFENASVKNFNKINKQAKDLKNTLAGFDEMNILPDQSSGGDVKTPSMDLSKSFEQIEPPQWLKTFAAIVKPITDWMKDVIEKEGAVGVLKAIAVALGGLMILKTIGSLITGLFTKDVSAGINSFFTSFGKATEIIAILGGLSLVIMEITELIKAFAESGLSLQEVGILLVEVLGSVAIAFTALALATKLMDWTGIAAAAVILGGLALVLTTVTKLIDTFSKSGMTLGEVGGLLAVVFGSIVVLMGSVALLGPAMTAGLVPFLAVVVGISAILIVMAETLPTILDAASKFITSIAPFIIEYIKTMGTLLNELINTLGKVLPPIIRSVGSLFKDIFNGIAKVIKTVGDSLNNILSGVGSLVSSVLGSILSFITRLGPAINTFVDNAIQAVTKLINFMVSGIEYLVNTLIIGGVNKIIDAINSIGKYVGITIGRLDRMSIPRFRPTFAAKGAIINMPGRGVPVGNGVNGGERGREGIIPLTDTEQMALLGEEIGKNVVINLTNILKMDSREIGRETRRANAKSDFATNRG